MEQRVHMEGAFDHKARFRTVVDEALLEAEGAKELQRSGDAQNIDLLRVCQDHRSGTRVTSWEDWTSTIDYLQEERSQGLKKVPTVGNSTGLHESR